MEWTTYGRWWKILFSRSSTTRRSVPTNVFDFLQATLSTSSWPGGSQIENHYIRRRRRLLAPYFWVNLLAAFEDPTVGSSKSTIESTRNSPIARRPLSCRWAQTNELKAKEDKRQVYEDIRATPERWFPNRPAVEDVPAPVPGLVNGGRKKKQHQTANIGWFAMLPLVHFREETPEEEE